jgi:hypothetical protein
MDAERLEEVAGNGAHELRNWVTTAAVANDASARSVSRPVKVLSVEDKIAEERTGGQYRELAERPVGCADLPSYADLRILWPNSSSLAGGVAAEQRAPADRLRRPLKRGR